MNISLKDITANALIAALYVALTLVSLPISFLSIQFRIAEILILLCFFKRSYAIGLTLGCVIANIFSSIGLIDCAFGGAATLLSCLGIMFCKHLLVASIIPVVINSLIVGLELFLFLKEPFFISCLSVGLGELAVLVFGYIFFFFMHKNKNFIKLIDATQNVDFKF